MMDQVGVEVKVGVDGGEAKKEPNSASVSMEVRAAPPRPSTPPSLRMALVRRWSNMLLEAVFGGWMIACEAG